MIANRGQDAKTFETLLGWLERAPKTVDRLVLTAQGMPDQVILNWGIDEVLKQDVRDTATHLYQQALDWAHGIDRECRFVVQWFREDVAVVALPFRCGLSWQGGGGVGTTFDGSAPDIIGQLQRHLEIKEKTFVGALKHILDAQNYVIDQQRQELQDARAHKLKLDEREEALRLDELKQLVEELEGGDAERLAKLFDIGLKIAEQVKSLGPGKAEQPPKKPETTTH